MCWNVLEAGQRIAAQPKVKKEPITPHMMLAVCSKFASATANLSDLRVAALFVVSYAAFLRFDEFSKLRCCDISFPVGQN